MRCELREKKELITHVSHLKTLPDYLLYHVSMTLSVIIPAYNEALRLPATLRSLADAKEVLTIREVIIVDDGSTDDTSRVANENANGLPLQVIRFPVNKGKGAAAKEGMLRSTSDAALLFDADSATPITEVSKLLDRMNRKNADIVIGSRMLGEHSIVSMSVHRRIIGWFFHLLCMPLLPGIADASCGCKLFTKGAIGCVFPRQRFERFAHDIELLLIARRMHLYIEEVPVTWSSVGGSKVRLLRDGGEMFLRVLQLYSRLLTGNL